MKKHFVLTFSKCYKRPRRQVPPVWVRILPLDRLQDSGEVSTKRVLLSVYKEEQQLFSSKYIICGTATFFYRKLNKTPGEKPMKPTVELFAIWRGFIINTGIGNPKMSDNSRGGSFWLFFLRMSWKRVYDYPLLRWELNVFNGMNLQRRKHESWKR